MNFATPSICGLPGVAADDGVVPRVDLEPQAGRSTRLHPRPVVWSPYHRGLAGTQILKRILLGVAVGAVLLALARPRWGYRERKPPRRDSISWSCLTCPGPCSRRTPPQSTREGEARAVRLDRSRPAGSHGPGGLCRGFRPLDTLDDRPFVRRSRVWTPTSFPFRAVIWRAPFEAAFGKDSTGARAILVLTDGEDHEPGLWMPPKLPREGIRPLPLGTAAGAVLP